MRRDIKKMHKKLDRDQRNGSQFKIRGTNYGSPVHRRDGEENF